MASKKTRTGKHTERFSPTKKKESSRQCPALPQKKQNSPLHPNGNDRELFRLVRLMCDNVPDMIWAKDLKGRFIFTNRAVCKRLLNAKSTDETVGKTHAHFARRERASHAALPSYHTFGRVCGDSDAIVMKEKKPRRFDEFGNVRGKFLHLDVCKAPFLDERGRMIGTVGCGRDVTKEKQMEEEHQRVSEELKKSESKYRVLFETCTDGIFIQTIEGRILDCNPSACEMFGYTRKEMRTLRAGDLVPRKVRSRHLGLLKTAGHNGGIAVKTSFRRKGGQAFPSELSARLAEIEGERMIVAFIRDISAHEKVEHDLRESRRFLSSVFSSIQDGISVLDKELRIIQVNPAIEKWHADAMPLVGKKCYAAYHGRSRPCRVCPSHQAIKTGRPAYDIVPQKRGANGVPGWREVFSFPLKDELTGRTRGVIEYSRNITERKLSEENLKESEQKYSLVTRETGQLIYDYNIETGDIIWSGAIREVTGYSSEEFRVNIAEWEKRIHPDDRPLAIGLLDEARKKGQRYSAEYRFQVRDGRYREIRDTGIFLKDKKGRRLRMIGTMTDITGHKQADLVRNAIYKISEAVNSTENLEELFRSIHHIIIELMPAKNFYIALYDSVSETLSFPYWIDEYDEKPAPSKLGRGLTEYVLRTGEPLLALPEKFEALVKSGQVESIGAPSIDWLGVPLKTKDRTIGVLVVQTYTEGVRYGEEDKDMLVFVSTQAAMAIERKRAEEALRQSEKTARAILNASPDLAILIDARGTILALNDSFAQTLGRSKEELLGTTAYGHIPPGLASVRKEHIEEVVRTGVPIRFEDESGGKCYDNAIYPILNSQGKAERVAVFAHDITKRKIAAKALLDSLKEKEVLLKEIHHRVKNNMQVICSLLNLQSKYLKDETALEMFKESQNRIRSMALVHEKLYQSKDLSRINFAEYIQSVVGYLFRSYQVDSSLVELKMNLQDTLININIAIPCGLIVNELVSNCQKHAFPDGRPGEVAIELKQKESQRYGLIIRDNGVGFPRNLDFERTETFGMQVVKTLVDQIDGAISLDRREGTAFTIEFGEPSDRPGSQQNV